MRAYQASLAFFIALFISGRLAPASFGVKDFCFREPPAAETCDIAAIIAQSRKDLATMRIRHADKMVVFKKTVRANGKATLRDDRDWLWREVPVALLNARTCQTTLSIAWKEGKPGKEAGISSIDPRFTFAIEPRLSGTNWNWWNTGILAAAADTAFLDRFVVVALAWKRPGGATAIYSPVSADLLETYPELSALGRSHLELKSAAARIRLRRLHVGSIALPDMQLADVVEKHFAGTLTLIPLIEHTDEEEVAAYRQGKILVDPYARLLAEIGANLDMAKAYTKSKAGAEGLWQVMPKTYKGLRANRPEAELLPDCANTSCFQDEQVTASALLLDEHTAYYIRKLGSEILRDRRFPGMQLAGYNTGPARVVRGVSKKTDWKDSLLPETIGYLAKQQAVLERAALAAR
jgi:hypothetical protein